MDFTTVSFSFVIYFFQVPRPVLQRLYAATPPNPNTRLIVSPGTPLSTQRRRNSASPANMISNTGLAVSHITTHDHLQRHQSLPSSTINLIELNQSNPTMFSYAYWFPSVLQTASSDPTAVTHPSGIPYNLHRANTHHVIPHHTSIHYTSIMHAKSLSRPKTPLPINGMSGLYSR